MTDSAISNTSDDDEELGKDLGGLDDLLTSVRSEEAVAPKRGRKSMWEINSNNILYGEDLFDRHVWIDVMVKDLTRNQKRQIIKTTKWYQKAIIQITNWRIIVTILGNEINDHKGYLNFSWSEIKEISTSSNWVTIALRDDGAFSFMQDNAEIASIKLWAFSELIKMEKNKNHPSVNPRSQNNNIILKCRTKVTHIGKWALILRSYGAIINEGETPAMQYISRNLSIETIKGAFARKNIEIIHKETQNKIKRIEDAYGFKWILKEESNNLSRHWQNITIVRWSIENEIIHLYSDRGIDELGVKISEILSVVGYGKDAVKISIPNGQIIFENIGNHQSGGLLLDFMTNLSLIINQLKIPNSDTNFHVVEKNAISNTAAKLLMTYKQIIA